MKRCQSCSSPIVVYSQNVSCDIHSEKLKDMPGMGEEYSFSNRIKQVVKSIVHNRPDVVALNEVRYKEFVNELIALLEEQGYMAQSFANNDGHMSFNNILAISETSEWEVMHWKHKWVAVDQLEQPYLEDKHCVIEGDPHGRGAGIAYLKHKTTNLQVCVLVSHVIPFGKVKTQQQNALLSLSQKNMQSQPPIPTMIVGDLNRFYDEKEQFSEQLLEYHMLEAVPQQFIIPTETEEIRLKGEDIGTFSPWPTDMKMYDKLLKEPISKSPLDVHVYTNDPSLIRNESVITYASMLKSPNRDPPPDGRNPVRHMLDRRMASDHIAIIGRYSMFG
uniref:Uncharacterized protein LOC100175991 n=1 Tax=Phallusia mammillata TaxID=59560 RepID=A0A6F9DGK2_9ASCI|nr:uncharacterized protein LOC100175991 [Phallusia mammillata]